MFGLFTDRHERNAAVEIVKRMKKAKTGDSFTIMTKGTRIVLTAAVHPMSNMNPIKPLTGVEQAISGKTTVIVEQDPLAQKLDQPAILPEKPKDE